MHHLLRHPSPVPGCFGCKTLNVGVQTLQIKFGKRIPPEVKPVVADDGRRAGSVVGRHEVYWDGRQDATAMPAPVKVKLKLENE